MRREGRLLSLRNGKLVALCWALRGMHGRMSCFDLVEGGRCLSRIMCQGGSVASLNIMQRSNMMPCSTLTKHRN